MALTPTQLLKRLAALVPAPKRHTVRYFRVFAPSAGIRAKVIRVPALRRRRACEAAPMHSDTGLDEEAVRTSLRDRFGFDPLALGLPPVPEQARRLDWPSLLQRVFATNIFDCACGGRRRVVAFVTDTAKAVEILEELGLPAEAPKLERARGPPRQEELFDRPIGELADPVYPDI